jgi:hypothetical protein
MTQLSRVTCATVTPRGNTSKLRQILGEFPDTSPAFSNVNGARDGENLQEIFLSAPRDMTDDRAA